MSAEINEKITAFLDGEESTKARVAAAKALADHYKDRPPRLDSFSGWEWLPKHEELEEALAIAGGPIPNYSTDEAANARLLQKLVDRATPYGIAVSIGVRHCDSYDGKSVYWLETVEKYGDDELIPVQEASSIQEAVVLAFLKFANLSEN